MELLIFMAEQILVKTPSLPLLVIAALPPSLHETFTTHATTMHLFVHINASPLHDIARYSVFYTRKRRSVAC